MGGPTETGSVIARSPGFAGATDTRHDDDTELQTLPGREIAGIVRDPRICGGEPTVAGTRVPVSAIVVQWQFYQDCGRVLRAFPCLTDDSLDAAITYYDAHRQEIDRLIDDAERAASTPD